MKPITTGEPWKGWLSANLSHCIQYHAICFSTWYSASVLVTFKLSSLFFQYANAFAGEISLKITAQLDCFYLVFSYYDLTL